MKKHITQEAIANVVRAYQQTVEDEDRAAHTARKEYFFGKRIGLIDTFALLTGIDWLRAEAILRTRACLTPRTPYTLLLTTEMRVK